MPERFRVVCTIQGAIQVLWFFLLSRPTTFSVFLQLMFTGWSQTLYQSVDCTLRSWHGIFYSMSVKVVSSRYLCVNIFRLRSSIRMIDKRPEPGALWHASTKRYPILTCYCCGVNTWYTTQWLVITAMITLNTDARNTKSTSRTCYPSMLISYGPSSVNKTLTSMLLGV